MNTLKRCYPADGAGFAIEALEDSLVWCIPGNLAKNLCGKYIRFANIYTEILMRDHMISRQAVRCSHPGHGFENFKALCQQFPQIIGRVPTKYLADFIQVPEKALKHLLESQLSLHGNLKRRRRSRPSAEM